MYELLEVRPHEPDDARYTASDFARYREGYAMALVMALRVMDAAERRYKIYLRTRKLETRRRRKAAKHGDTVGV